MALTLAVKVTADASALKAEVQSAGQAITDLGTKARSSGQALGDAAAAEAAAMAELRSAVTGAGTAAELSGRAAQDMADQAVAAARATSDEAAAIQALKDKVDPLAAKQREAAASLELWKSWADQGKISQQELAIATGQLESEIGRMQAAAAGAARNTPWWMNSNVTRNWIDVVQQLAMTGGQIQYALPSIIDAADVTNYYREQAERAGKASATMAGSIQASGAGAAQAAAGLADAAAGTVLVKEAAAGAATKATAAGTAFAGLTGTVLLVGGAVAALTGTLLLGVAAWHSHTDAVEQVQRAHQVVGGYLALTGDEMAAMAASAANAGAISVAAARDMQTAFISTRSVGAATMETLIGLSRDWAEVTGGDVADAGADLARVFAEPRAAVDALDKQFNLLTATEKTQITTLIDHGKKTEAQAILADKLKERIQGLHAEAVNPLTAAFETLGRVAANAWNSIGAAITRAVSGASDGAKLATAESELSALKAKKEFNKDTSDWAYAIGHLGDTKADLDADIAAKEKEVALRRAQVGLTKQLADERAKTDQGKLDAKAAAETLKSYDAIGQRQKQIAAEVAQISAGAAADPAIADAAGRTLSRLGQEYADLTRAQAAGYHSTQQYQEALRAEAQATAATMGKAGAVWLASETARIDALFTTTDATDRDTAAQTARTSALAQQTAALTAAMVANDAELKGANAIADAYATSTAEGLRAEAMAAALAEAQSSGAGAAWAAAEANRQLAVDVAQARAETEQLIDSVQADTADSTALTQAILGGYDAEMAETIRQQVAEATQAQADRIAALTDETLKQSELVKLEGERKALAEALTEGAIAERRQQFALELRDQQSSLALVQAELSVVGLTGAERTQVLALIQAENDLKQYGKSLSAAERQQYIDTAVAIAAVNTELEQANALKGVFEDAAHSLSSAFRDALDEGIDGFEDFADDALEIFKDLKLDIADQLVFTPVINAIVGYSYTDTLSALGLSTGTTATGTTATGTSTSSSLLSGSSTTSASLYLANNSGSNGLSSFLNSTAFSYGGELDDTANAIVNEVSVSYGNVASAALSGVSAVLDFSEGQYISGIADTISTVLAFTPLAWAAPIVSIAGTLFESLFGDMLYGDEDHANAGMQFVSSSTGGTEYVGSYALDGAESEDWDGQGSDMADYLSTVISSLGATFDSSVLSPEDGQVWIGYDSGWSGEGYYLTYDPEDYKEHGDTVQWFDDLEGATLQLLKDMVTSGALTGLSEDTLTAGTNSTATTLDDYASDLSFGYAFDYNINNLLQNSTNLEDSIEATVAASMQSTLETIKEFKATTAELGLDTAAADSATQTYVSYLVGIEDAPEEMSEVEQSWASLEATFSDSNLQPLLDEVGLSAYAAADLLAAAEEEIRADYTDSLTEQINEAQDKSYLNDAQTVWNWYDAEAETVATVGAGAAETLDLLNEYLADLVEQAGGGQAAIDELAAAVPELADQLTALSADLMADYVDSLTADLYDAQDKGYLNDLGDLSEWYADALTRVGTSTEAAAAVAGILSASLEAIVGEAGTSAEAIAELTAAAPELADAIAAAAAATVVASSEDLADASVSLLGRSYDATGQTMASTLLSFDYNAAAERADYAELGGDLAAYDATVWAERVAAELGVYADQIDQQIGATQELIDSNETLVAAMQSAADTAEALRLDSDLTTLSAWEQLAEMRDNYAEAKAAAYDTTLSVDDRAAAIEEFNAAAEARAQVERDYWSDSAEYDAAFTEIQSDLLGLSGDALTTLEDSAATLDDQLTALEALAAAIDDATAADALSVDDLQTAVTLKLDELTAAQTNLSGVLSGFAAEVVDLAGQLGIDISNATAGTTGTASLGEALTAAATGAGYTGSFGGGEFYRTASDQQIWSVFNAGAAYDSSIDFAGALAIRSLGFTGEIPGDGSGGGGQWLTDNGLWDQYEERLSELLAAGVPATQAYARGTLSAAAGWALVGEEGPELVRMRGGEQVYTAAETAALLAHDAGNDDAGNDDWRQALNDNWDAGDGGDDDGAPGADDDALVVPAPVYRAAADEAGAAAPRVVVVQAPATPPAGSDPALQSMAAAFAQFSAQLAQLQATNEAQQAELIAMRRELALIKKQKVA